MTRAGTIVSGPSFGHALGNISAKCPGCTGWWQLTERRPDCHVIMIAGCVLVDGSNANCACILVTENMEFKGIVQVVNLTN